MRLATTMYNVLLCGCENTQLKLNFKLSVCDTIFAVLSVYIIHSQFCHLCQLLFTLENVGGCPSSTWIYQLLFLLLGSPSQQCPLQEIQDPLEALGGCLHLLSLLLSNITIIQQSCMITVKINYWQQ